MIKQKSVNIMIIKDLKYFLSFLTMKELARKIIFWSPKHGRRSVGRPTRTYTDQLADDTGLRIEDIPAAMLDRLGFRERIKRNRDFST